MPHKVELLRSYVFGALLEQHAIRVLVYVLAAIAVLLRKFFPRCGKIFQNVIYRRFVRKYCAELESAPFVAWAGSQAHKEHEIVYRDNGVLYVALDAGCITQHKREAVLWIALEVSAELRQDVLRVEIYV